MTKWNDHTVACLLAEIHSDNCACNFHSIDEWLPFVCDFADTCCPAPVGVACWEQYLKYRKYENTDPEILVDLYYRKRENGKSERND